MGDEPRRTDLQLSFESSGDARYEFFDETLTLGQCRGEIEIDRSRVHLTELQANLFGGSLILEYDALDVRSSSRPYVALLQVKNMPLEEIMRTYHGKENITGQIEGIMKLSGNAGGASTLQGSSTLRISEGNLFSIPVFGPLSKLISSGNPDREAGGSAIVREATATIQITDGVMTTKDLEALADSFEVRSAGSVSLVTSEVDLEAVVNTRGGLSRAILTPVSELLTYSCTGTVNEPVWKAKHISNLGKLPAQVITEITNVPVEGLKAIGKSLFGEKDKPQGIETGGPDSRENPEEQARPRLFNRILQPEGAKEEER